MPPALPTDPVHNQAPPARLGPVPRPPRQGPDPAGRAPPLADLDRLLPRLRHVIQIPRNIATAGALTCWLETGRTSWAEVGQPVDYRPPGRELAGCALSMLRPKIGARGDNSAMWLELTQRAGRVRIFSTSCLEAVLVAEGAIDAFADAGSDTHRIVDLAAAMVIVPAAGGFVCEAYGRPLEFSTDLTLRVSGVVATRQLADEIRAVIPA